MKHPTGMSPCPTWCVSLHLDGETLHYGESAAIELLQRPTSAELRFRPEVPATPTTLELVTHREAGESETWVAVLRDGAAILDLTAASAARLGSTLQSLAGDTSA
ncbi:DUF6907 domain-containing protein [Pseudoclavibacter sp. VKM Ac-2867]|uniref:DUF6907 domain-containing protein n=1 Tax=Pseudoclavibacter sp. VKM Ac-2867 TaxID=2783829 RepID=UPI00188B1F62|nr:hypothetical protein [Pseudoclavibacter sp. VKM Ac-2867]MBF4457742.1 hypothetical protein [Pseudoclavibacter sp. VKM Ac-2867]